MVNDFTYCFGQWDYDTAEERDLEREQFAAMLDEKVPGVGVVLAARIVAASEESALASCDDMIERVKGIGPKNAVKMCAVLAFVLD